MAGVEEVGEDATQLQYVVDSLLKHLAVRLGLPREDGLTPHLVTGLARKLGLRSEGDVSLSALLVRMKYFGLDLEHIELKRLEEEDLLHQYFLLDLANVLLDSVEQVKQARTTQLLKNQLEEAGGSSGGEEVARILAEARAKYGKIRSFRDGLDQANISFIKPQKLPEQVPPQNFVRSAKDDYITKSVSTSETTEDRDTVDNVLKTKAQPKSKRRKMSKDSRKDRREKVDEKETISVGDKLGREKVDEKENISVGDKPDDDDSEPEINVNIPISETTDVMIKVKPLDSKDLKSQRIHVRVNQHPSKDDEVDKSKSKHILYGSKSIVSHHLRKPRAPMFSKKQATPRLDRKQVIERVVSEVRKARNAKENDQDEEIYEAKNKDFMLRAQRVLREKRTKNAQFRKMINKL